MAKSLIVAVFIATVGAFPTGANDASRGTSGQVGLQDYTDFGGAKVPDGVCRVEFLSQDFDHSMSIMHRHPVLAVDVDELGHITVLPPVISMKYGDVMSGTSPEALQALSHNKKGYQTRNAEGSETDSFINFYKRGVLEDNIAYVRVSPACKYLTDLVFYFCDEDLDEYLTKGTLAECKEDSKGGEGDSAALPMKLLLQRYEHYHGNSDKLTFEWMDDLANDMSGFIVSVDPGFVFEDK
jgi:hypothetical protein